MGVETQGVTVVTVNSGPGWTEELGSVEPTRLHAPGCRSGGRLAPGATGCGDGGSDGGDGDVPGVPKPVGLDSPRNSRHGTRNPRGSRRIGVRA